MNGKNFFLQLKTFACRVRAWDVRVGEGRVKVTGTERAVLGSVSVRGGSYADN